MDRIEQMRAEGILLTDMSQLTMTQHYFCLGMHETLVQFDHFFRDYPNYGSQQAGFCVNAGLEWLVDWMADVELLDPGVRRIMNPHIYHVSLTNRL